MTTTLLATRPVVRYTIVTVLLVFTSSLAAQDLGDIDMFGGSEEQQAETPEDPLDLGDFGGFDAPEETPGDMAAQPERPTIEQVMEQGIELAERGEIREAIRTFNDVLNPEIGGNPNFAPALYELGKLYFDIEEFDLARQSFESAIGSGAQFPDLMTAATLKLGEVYLELGSNSEAVEILTSVVTSDPFNVEGLVLRAKAQVRAASSFAAGPGASELVQSAIDSLDRALEIDAENTEALVQKLQARTVQQQLRAQSGRRADPRALNDNVDDANKLLSLDRETSDFHARQGFAYFGRGDDEFDRHDADRQSAISDWRTAIAAFDEYLRLEGDTSKEDYDDAEPDKVRRDQILNIKTDTMLKLGQQLSDSQARDYYSRAIESANELIEYDPDSPAGYYFRAVAHRLLGDLRAAIESFNTALEISPGNTEFALRRGITWYYLGENLLARRDFEDAEPAFDGRALFWIGVTEAKEGNFQDAVKYYTGALRLNPSFKPAFNNRGLAYMRLKDYARAEKDFDQLVRRDNDDDVSRQRRDQARQMKQAEQMQPPVSRYYP